jgi:hypothetical protein
MSATPPILGTTVTISGTDAPAGASGLLLASAIPISPLLAGTGPTFSIPCSIYGDLASLIVLGPITAGGSGSWSVSVLLPNTPAAAGFFVPNNGLAVTIGY